MKYEIKRSGADPYDTMCGDCPVHEIEWWENVTAEELHELHQQSIEDDHHLPICEIVEMMEQGTWKPTDPDFNIWVAQMVADGWLREAA